MLTKVSQVKSILGKKYFGQRVSHVKSITGKPTTRKLFGKNVNEEEEESF